MSSHGAEGHSYVASTQSIVSDWVVVLICCFCCIPLYSVWKRGFVFEPVLYSVCIDIVFRCVFTVYFTSCCISKGSRNTIGHEIHLGKQRAVYSRIQHMCIPNTIAIHFFQNTPEREYTKKWNTTQYRAKCIREEKEMYPGIKGGCSDTGRPSPPPRATRWRALRAK